MSALLFGSISTLADTSEMQREAFNQAFAEHGLDWQWERDDYRRMLAQSGGQGRVDEYARSLGQTVDAKAVHETKSRLFQQNVAKTELTARPGVLESIKAAKDNGWKVGLVTTTSGDNVSALLGAFGSKLGREDFDVVVDSASVDSPKPDAAAYTFAIGELGEQADGCVAIEDNVNGVESAVAAGVACVAFPNQNTAGHDFGQAERRVERLDADELAQLASHS